MAVRDYHRRKKGGVRDFSRRRYGNPLFPTRTSPRARKRGGPKLDVGAIKKWTLFGLGAAVICGICWYLFWSPAFQVTDVTVTGASPETEATLRGLVTDRTGQRAVLFFPQRSVFLFDEKALTGDIGDRFFFETLDVRKKLPHSVMITVTEKPVTSVFVADNRFLALDAGGAVIRELTPKESFALADLPDELGSAVAGELGAESVDLTEIAPATDAPPDPAELKRNRNPHPLILIKGRTDASAPAPGDPAVSSAALDTVLQAYARLPDLTGSGVKWFVLDPAAESVEAVLREGWSVHLSTAIPFETQGERLALILKEKVGERKSQLDYVDLRYDERIFFRFLDGATE